MSNSFYHTRYPAYDYIHMSRVHPDACGAKKVETSRETNYSYGQSLCGKKMHVLAVAPGYEPIVPPKRNFKEHRDYDKEIYKRRNEVERFFRRLKHFRGIFTRYDRSDVLFADFILFVLMNTLKQ